MYVYNENTVVSVTDMRMIMQRRIKIILSLAYDYRENPTITNGFLAQISLTAMLQNLVTMSICSERAFVVVVVFVFGGCIFLLEVGWTQCAFHWSIWRSMFHKKYNWMLLRQFCPPPLWWEILFRVKRRKNKGRCGRTFALLKCLYPVHFACIFIWQKVPFLWFGNCVHRWKLKSNECTVNVL